MPNTLMSMLGDGGDKTGVATTAPKPAERATGGAVASVLACWEVE